MTCRLPAKFKSSPYPGWKMLTNIVYMQWTLKNVYSTLMLFIGGSWITAFEVDAFFCRISKCHHSEKVLELWNMIVFLINSIQIRIIVYQNDRQRFIECSDRKVESRIVVILYFQHRLQKNKKPDWFQQLSLALSMPALIVF